MPIAGRREGMAPEVGIHATGQVIDTAISAIRGANA
jgi:hypothetical protein